MMSAILVVFDREFQLLEERRVIHIIATILREKEIGPGLLDLFLLLRRRKRQQALVTDLTIHTVPNTNFITDNHIVIRRIQKRIGTWMWFWIHR